MPRRENHSPKHRLLTRRMQSDAIEFLNRHTDERREMLERKIEVVLILSGILEVDEVRIVAFLRNDGELDERRGGPALKRLVRQADLVLPRRLRLFILSGHDARHEKRGYKEKHSAMHSHHPFCSRKDPRPPHTRRRGPTTPLLYRNGSTDSTVRETSGPPQRLSQSRLWLVIASLAKQSPIPRVEIASSPRSS